MRILWVLVLLISLEALGSAENLEPPLLFHASFDGTLDAAACGQCKPVRVDGPVVYRPGRFGQALLCGEGGAAVTYAAAGNLRAAAGTVEMWVCPLDWTGAEDEFHVFLEALDPGRLVFYRYYQGGITTLLGRHGGDYRAAVGPRISWKAGEWHHLAGTWRGSELAVYVDGKCVGRAEKPPVPDRLAATFRVGDCPWHVARKRQTLVDEIKIYSAPLDPASIARAARSEPVRFQPKMLLGLTGNAATAKLAIACDAAGLIDEKASATRARVELIPKGSRDPAARAEIDTFPTGIGRCEFSTRNLPEGDYDVRAVLLGNGGQPLAQEVIPFHMPGPPVWSGNTLGMDDKVLTPWTPLKVDATAPAIQCWGRRYQFGTLLDAVQSSGEGLLSSPVSLEAVVAGKRMAISGTACRVDCATDTRAVLTGHAELSGLRVAVHHAVDFDGQVWTDVMVQPTRPVQLEELRLTWSMPKAQARLIHADARKWIDNPAGALKAEGWSSKLVPFFWLGNEDRGLCWYTESDRNWRLSKDHPAIQVTPEGEEVKICVRLLATPCVVSSDLTYSFGMMATPVRPRPEDARRWRMAPGTKSTFEILWPNGWMKWYGHPEPKDAKALAAHVSAAHKLGRLVVPYVNLNFVSAGVPEWQYYGSQWADPSRVVTPSDVAAMGYASMGTCPAVRDWQDFILYRINEMIDRFQVDGIYIDCWSPYPCITGSCAWHDEHGAAHPTWPIRAYRQILKRVYTLFRQKHPNSLLMVHMSSEVTIPMLSFTDTILDGEQFSTDRLKDDYLDLLPPDKFRAEFLGRNWGPVAFFLPEFRGRHAASGTPNLAAWLLLHDVGAWPMWSDVRTWNRLYDSIDAREVADAAFLPYWEDCGARADSQVLVSSYVGGSAALLAVINTGEAIAAEISLDGRRLRLERISAAADVLSGEKLKVQSNVLAIPLSRHQGRVILLKP